MDFELSDDQLALRSAARELLDDLSSPARVRKVVDAGGGYDPELWSAMHAQGWLDLESAGFGFVAAAVLCEEIGRHVAPAPFASTLLARWAGGAIPEGGVGALAWRDDPVIYAPSADGIVVIDDPVRAVPGPRSPREPAMDQTRELGWVAYDRSSATALAVDAGNLLDRAVVAVSSEMLGAASWALDTTVAYAKDRVQFGRPIGSFQAVKHRCADMLVDVEGMRSTVYWAAWCIEAGHPDASVAASTAKVWCSDAARRVMASALQVHGGIGFTWDHDLHLYLKRSQLDQVSFGDAPFHRGRLARLLRPRVEAGDSMI